MSAPRGIVLALQLGLILWAAIILAGLWAWHLLMGFGR